MAHALGRRQPLGLQAVMVDGDLRRRVFDRAAQALAAARGKPLPAATIDLSDPLYGRMLYLHMAALAGVEGLPMTAGALLDEIVAHEERYWGRQFQERYRDQILDLQAFAAAARRTMAALTLVGGAPTAQAADQLKAQVQGPHEPQFCPFLHWLFPGEDDPGAQNRYVRGLEPDLLGETLVRRVLNDTATPQAYLTRVFEGAVETAVRNGFLVLSRLALRGEAAATGWIEQVLDADVPGRAGAALDAALTLSADTAHAPLGTILARALERKGTLELAKMIERLVPKQTVSLREVGAWATERQLLESPSPSERARLLNNLGNRLSQLGRPEQALAAAEEALEIRRMLAAARPDAFLPDLAGSLNNLGLRLSALGRPEQALAAAEEAVERYSTLVERLPQPHLQKLMAAVRSLRQRLQEAGLEPAENPAFQRAAQLLERLQPAGE